MKELLRRTLARIIMLIIAVLLIFIVPLGWWLLEPKGTKLGARYRDCYQTVWKRFKIGGL